MYRFDNANTATVEKLIAKTSVSISKTSLSTGMLMMLDYARQNSYALSESTQVMASRYGNALEVAYNIYINENLSGLFADVERYTTGNTLLRTIKVLRKLHNDNMRDHDVFVEGYELLLSYKMDKAYIESVITFSDRSINLPDSIVILKNGKIRIAEAKTSGENDNSSVSKNLDKIRFDTENSAVAPWKESKANVERALIITATELNSRGISTTASRWSNLIAKLDENIAVYANEEAFNWLTCAGTNSLNYTKYQNELLLPTAIAVVKKSL
jgi:hypothetical protein